jgi:hypothetical protein
LRPDDFHVDSSCPGRAELERYFARTLPKPPASGGLELSRLFYLDIPVTPADSLQSVAFAAMRNLMDSQAGFDQRWIDPLFAIRCPVVCAPELRRYVRALGPDSLVGLLDCRPATAKR